MPQHLPGRARPRPRQPASARSRLTSLASASLLALGLLPPGARAQSDATAAAPKEAASAEQVIVTGQRGDSYTVKETSAATKLDLSLRDTPQSVTVVTRERLDDQGLTSLRQVLDNTPGLYSNAYDTERVLFYSRGFLVDTLMYDGLPATTNFNTGSIDETLDTALYERIEIVRGATGLTTGFGSPAASVNLVRKHADSKTLEASFDLTLGSWRQRRGVFDLSVPLNADASVRARAVAVADDRESYQDLYRKKTSVFYGIVDADLTPDTRASLGIDFQNNRPRSNTWGSFPLYLGDGTLADWPRSVTTATDWTYWNRKTQTVFGELHHGFASGWQLHSSVSRRRYEEESRLFYVFGYPDPETGLGLDPYADASKGKIVETAFDVFASGPFELLGRKHELLAGYNRSRTKNTGTAFELTGELAPVGNFFEWDGRYPEPEFDAEGIPLSDIRTTQDGVYLATRLSPADGVKLIAGARYARWKIDSYYLYDSPEDSKYDLKKTIPYAGLVWDFSPQFSAFASYTGIYKPQNNRDVNGSLLDPIDGKSFELGVKGQHFQGQLNSALTVFETRQNNVAAPVLDPDTGEPILLPDGSAVSRPIDGTRTRGFELELSGRLAPQWQASFGWTRYVTEDADGQAVRTFIPGTLVRLFTTWEPRSLVQGLKLGAGVNWQSASRTAVGAPDGGAELRQGSFTQVSLMADYEITRQIALQLNANNVFDKKFYVLDEFDNTYYGAPANYTVTLRMSY